MWYAAAAVTAAAAVVKSLWVAAQVRVTLWRYWLKLAAAVGAARRLHIPALLYFVCSAWLHNGGFMCPNNIWLSTLQPWTECKETICEAAVGVVNCFEHTQSVMAAEWPSLLAANCGCRGQND
jgi:hypothetical protein